MAHFTRVLWHRFKLRLTGRQICVEPAQPRFRLAENRNIDASRRMSLSCNSSQTPPLDRFRHRRRGAHRSSSFPWWETVKPKAHNAFGRFSTVGRSNCPHRPGAPFLKGALVMRLAVMLVLRVRPVQPRGPWGPARKMTQEGEQAPPDENPAKE